MEYERTRKQKSRVLIKIHAYNKEMVRSDRFADLILWLVDKDARADNYNLAKTTAFQKVRTPHDFQKEIMKGS